jgi:hypothetical protein
VVLSGGVEDACDLLILTLCPRAVCWTTVMSDSPEDGRQAQGDDCLLIDDQDLIADSCDGDTGTCGENGGLGGQVAAGEGVKDGLGLLLGGFLRDTRGVPRGGDGSNGSERYSWAEELSSAC